MLAASRDSVSSMCTAREPEAWPVGLGFCRLIPSFLSAAECAAMVALAEGAGFGSAATDYPPSYRDNERLVHDDRALAARLFERLHGRAPERLLSAAADGTPQHVRLARINERLRFCRYRAGQQFRIHQDGVYFADEQHRSHLTFMIYLTDGEAFEGGDTVFLRARA